MVPEQEQVKAATAVLVAPLVAPAVMVEMPRQWARMSMRKEMTMVTTSVGAVTVVSAVPKAELEAMGAMRWRALAQTAQVSTDLIPKLAAAAMAVLRRTPVGLAARAAWVVARFRPLRAAIMQRLELVGEVQAEMPRVLAATAATAEMRQLSCRIHSEAVAVLVEMPRER